MNDCEHKNFKCYNRVNRLSKEEGGPITSYSVEVQVRCSECGLPFHFIGLPGGSTPANPTVNIDATELRAPIAPGPVQFVTGRIIE